MQKRLKYQAVEYAHFLAALMQHNSIGGKLKSARRGARHLSLGARLTNPMDADKALKLAEPLALATRSEAVLAGRVEGLIVYQFQLSAANWQTYTRAEVEGLNIGLAEQRAPVEFNFDDAPHALFAGTTGSGKTEAMKSALIAVLNAYTPEELQLVIIDQKNILGAFDNEAHLVKPRAIFGDDAAALLEWATNELNARIASGHHKHPRLMIVIDEVSMLPLRDKKTKTSDNLRFLAKIGREKRVHLMVGNQKPGQRNLSEIVDNLLNRFVGLVDNAGTSAQLTGHSGLAAHKLTGSGDFIHVVKGGAIRFQVALATASDFDSLRRVQPIEITPPAPIVAPEPVIVTPRRGGHKPLAVEPAPLAYYMRNQALSVRGAKRAIGFSRKRHNFYKTFLVDLKRYYNMPEKDLLTKIEGGHYEG